jgi:L-fuconolactonase
MTVIDAQVHIWEEGAARDASSPSGTRPGYEDALTVDRLLEAMDDAAVDGALLVTPGVYRGDNTYSLASAKNHRDRLAVVGAIRIGDHDFEELLSQWHAEPAMVGGRFVLRNHRDLDRLRMSEQLFVAAARYDIPLCVYPFVGMDAVRGIAQKYPNVQLVIDHLGLRSPRHGGSGLEGLDAALGLADLPNVAVKASSLPSQSSQAFPFEDVLPALHAALNAFGSTRVIWGSDFTMHRDRHSYREATDFVRASNAISPSEKEMLLGGAAELIFGWSPGCESQRQTTT